MTNSVTVMERGEQGGKGWCVSWGATAPFENDRWLCQIPYAIAIAVPSARWCVGSHLVGPSGRFIFV